MAGNNRLGGQDFNERIHKMLLNVRRFICLKENSNIQRIHYLRNIQLTNREDLQQLRLAVEEAKLNLTQLPETWIRLNFRSIGNFEYLVSTISDTNN